MDSDKTEMPSYEGFGVTAPYTVQQLKFNGIFVRIPRCLCKGIDVKIFCLKNKICANGVA
jgi:hypothetical protein